MKTRMKTRSLHPLDHPHPLVFVWEVWERFEALHLLRTRWKRMRTRMKICSCACAS